MSLENVCTDHGITAMKAVDTVSAIHPKRSALQISTMGRHQEHTFQASTMMLQWLRQSQVGRAANGDRCCRCGCFQRARFQYVLRRSGSKHWFIVFGSNHSVACGRGCGRAFRRASVANPVSRVALSPLRHAAAGHIQRR